ncbi:MAG: aminopeptidase N [Alphaproteobacteria bacterium]|nr:MAG: aminopeptidase N [Alphaproteobacteria bacterium]TAF16011.1 MAG: aminopeptidase N [Alphaproteobacteria bacterium]TAF76216.1 MAG: aminopeptidase N [Alphaproteobacteria bacterium]
MSNQNITMLHLRDYQALTHVIDRTELTFELLAENEVIVTSLLHMRPHGDGAAQPLHLSGAPEIAPNGSDIPTMELLEIRLDDAPYPLAEVQRVGERLTLSALPHRPFTLGFTTKINPQANRSLNGLYTSGGKFTTQCEAHGFRNITFYHDRPDCLSIFTTTIIAPHGAYAQLLSNGNPTERTLRADGRDEITWHDPYPKPCYLFALVAGNLDALRDTFTTRSGRNVDLVIYTDAGDTPRAVHAMESLKASMKWDEERFGREYDLDLFQIVAVHDFNFGAMENKGLNIFNAQAILADPDTATDTRYEFIQAVVAHEYFHNWSGNRVTCRDWFQLSLKEGFTVFRDAEFTADMNDRAVKRIDDVQDMRTVQFAEDASSMAHPIRPQSVGAIENFYTATVYEKGSEVIRMMHTMLGEATFRAGCDLYFDRHDGQAATTEDFVRAMQDASNASAHPIDLSQFEASWYNQAGTPTLDVRDSYDASSKRYTLHIRQILPTLWNQPKLQPFHIPVRLGLLSADGNAIPLHCETPCITNEDVLHVRALDESFVFFDVPERPTLSILRAWSAPVLIRYDRTVAEYAFLMKHDTDGFNRYEAGQQLMLHAITHMMRDGSLSEHVQDILISSIEGVLADNSLSPALMARSLTLPDMGYIAELQDEGTVNPEHIHHGRTSLKRIIAHTLCEKWHALYMRNRSTEARPYLWNVQDAGERALKNLALSYLVSADANTYLPYAIAQCRAFHNMTDVRVGLRLTLDAGDSAQRAEVLDVYASRYANNNLAMTQWFADQASADRSDVLSDVQSLLEHPAYDGKNPNNIRALIGSFAGNMRWMHHTDGSGYRFLADHILSIEQFNPMVAAGLSKRLATAPRFEPARRALMLSSLQHIEQHAFSPNVREIVQKTLASMQAPKHAA